LNSSGKKKPMGPAGFYEHCYEVQVTLIITTNYLIKKVLVPTPDHQFGVPLTYLPGQRQRDATRPGECRSDSGRVTRRVAMATSTSTHQPAARPAAVAGWRLRGAVLSARNPVDASARCGSVTRSSAQRRRRCSGSDKDLAGLHVPRRHHRLVRPWTRSATNHTHPRDCTPVRALITHVRCCAAAVASGPRSLRGVRHCVGA